VLVFCSVMFFLIEHGVNPEVTTFEDSVWYVVQTITTVGYGDVVPITSWGRVVGIIAMVSAIGISSLLTAATTSSLMDKLREDREKIVQKSVEYVAKIDDTVNDLEAQMAKEDDVKGIKTEINEIKSEITEIKNMLREIKE
jgi:voltage-gated potassium channel